jgi:hypothetical protein
VDRARTRAASWMRLRPARPLYNGRSYDDALIKPLDHPTLM